MQTSPARRSLSRWSATTRATIGPIVCQPTLSSRVIGANAICCASHATTSSKSRVCAAPGLDLQVPAALAALGAHPPPAPQPDRHEHALAGERDIHNTGAGKAQQAL